MPVVLLQYHLIDELNNDFLSLVLIAKAIVPKPLFEKTKQIISHKSAVYRYFLFLRNGNPVS
jgi:hypothetical protein